ncbi:MAG: flavoprotein [Planctomycetota bacterium]
MKGQLILGVSGSIAAFRAAELASALTQEGLEVETVMTERACDFVGPLTFKALTGRPVHTDDMPFNEPMAHIRLTDAAKLMLVAPASADALARLSLGLADDLLATTALTISCPLWVAPAMNTKMWEQAVTREHISRLTDRGVRILEPESGRLACGTVGSGRMMAVATIVEAVRSSGIFR